MATTASPYGLRPVNLVGGQVYAGSTRNIPIASGYNTAIGYGDIVQIATDGTITKVTTLGTAASQFPAGTVGVFLGCSYTDPNLKYKLFNQQWPANTVAADAIAVVCDDPDVIYQVQANGTLAQATLGGNYGVVQNAVNLNTGNSRVALDTATVGTATTLGFRVVGFVDAPGSAVGDAFTDVLVKFNHGIHTYYNATGVA